MNRRLVILEVVAKPLYVVILAASLVVLLRGHNEPGGGFIGGLLAVTASVLWAVAHGPDAATQRLPLRSPVRLAALGVLVGALSALLVALFGPLNKRLIDHGEPLTITGLELGAGTLLLTALAPLMPVLFPAFAGDLFVLPGLKDGVLLVVLSLACTLLPFALSLVALKHLSAYGVQLVTNLEPVYAIVLAIVLLGEQRELTPLFYLGVGIILAAVFLHPLTQRPKRIEHPEVLGTSEAKNIVE